MTGSANERGEVGAPLTEGEAGGGDAPAAPEAPMFESLVEGEGETPMVYDTGRVPWWVAAMWIGAAIGLGAYAARYAIPALIEWGVP